MNLFALSGLLTGITSLSIGLFVYLKQRATTLNRVWMIFTLSVSIWGFGCYKMASTANVKEAFLWYRLAHIGVILIPVFIYHFVFVFLNLRKKFTLKIIYLIGSIFFAANLIDLFGSYFFPDRAHYLIIAHMKWIFDSFYMDTPPGPLYPLFVLFFCATIGIIYYELIKALKSSAGTKSAQIKHFFIATIIGFVGGGSSFLPVFGINIYPVGNFATAVYPVIIAYAVLAYRFMDIEVIIKKTLIFAGLFVTSYAILIGFAYLGSLIFANIVRDRWIALVPSLLIIVLMLRPLESFLRKATDKYLFQRKYDYKQLLRTFTDEVLTVLNLNELVDLTVNKLAGVVKLENVAILLRDVKDKGFRVAAAIGFEESGYTLTGKDALVDYLEQGGEYAILEDSRLKKSINKNLGDKMHELNSELAIPLLHQKGVIGILSLGKKKSDEEFTQDDIDILLPLARALSIAITNAQLFEKLSIAQAQAAQREKMAVIGTLSAGINHEICNPLSIIRGQCETFILNLREGIYKSKSPKELLNMANEIMGKVIDETDRATIITRKLSSFAKPAERKSRSNVKLVDELDEVIALVQHELKLSNVSILKEIDDKLPFISADPKQLQEIFFNIIRNAAQAIDGSGNITIRARSDQRKVYIDVEDTGSGMDKEKLGQIFNPFFTTKSPGEGTGLGLFIVKQVVEKNDGEIIIESEPGKGTIVHLVFDVAKDEKA